MKRKTSSEKPSNWKKNQKVCENKNANIDMVINENIPHVGEQIFESIDTEELIQFLKVSSTWSSLAQKVLRKRQELFGFDDIAGIKIMFAVLEHKSWELEQRRKFSERRDLHNSILKILEQIQPFLT